MTVRELTDKIETLKLAYRKEKVAKIKGVIKNKIADAKQELKDMKVSTSKLAESLLGSQQKVKGYNNAQLKEAIKRLKPKAEYSFLLSRPYTSVEAVKRDLKRYAKPVGWRIRGAKNVDPPTPLQLARAKKRGTAYFENRPNRSDVVRPAKLEDGGMMAKGGGLQMSEVNKIVQNIKLTYKYDHELRASNNKGFLDIGVDVKTFRIALKIKSELESLIVRAIKKNPSIKNADSRLPFGGQDIYKKIDLLRESGDNPEESKYYITIHPDCSPSAIAHFFYILGKYTPREDGGKMEKGGGLMKMAQGGGLEHGLVIGDSIFDISGNMVYVKNAYTNKVHTIDISTGNRRSFPIHNK